MLTALRREHLPNNTLSWSHNMNCLRVSNNFEINPLNAELNPICHLLALLGAHHILHVSRIRVNPSKPSGYYIYQQFTIHKFYVLSTQCIYVLCVDLRTNSDYFPLHHYLTGFYNRDGVCLLRGTGWVFIYN